MIDNIMTTIVMLTPGILASKTYRLLTRQPQARTETYKAPEILLFAVIVYGLSDAIGVGPVWSHIMGLVTGAIAAQLAFFTSGAKWKDCLIWRHIRNRSLIPTWYSSFLAGDRKWWQIERKGKLEPIVCRIREWPSNPESGFYRIEAVSPERDHRKGGEYLIPAETIELLEIRDEPEEPPLDIFWRIGRKGELEPIVCHILDWPNNTECGDFRIRAVSEGRDHRKGAEYSIPIDTIERIEIRDDPRGQCPNNTGGDRRASER